MDEVTCCHCSGELPGSDEVMSHWRQRQAADMPVESVRL